MAGAKVVAMAMAVAAMVMVVVAVGMARAVTGKARAVAEIEAVRMVVTAELAVAHPVVKRAVAAQP